MSKVLDVIKNIMIYFICFAFIGWIYEVILFLVEDHIFVNRGVLYGPWLPVYGTGGLVIYYLFYRFKNKVIKVRNINIRPLLIFIYITITAVFIELLTTYICDFINSDWRTLWFYGDKFMNFEGRIALVPGLKFGLVGIIGVYLIVPLIDKIKNSNKKTTVSFTYVIILLFLIDVIIHLFIGGTYSGPV
ncbi:MAG: hypothetical protein E7158_03935 [Firmicutes bacterium]|nr:hypothetical protein [Bacillota bacterium]